MSHRPSSSFNRILKRFTWLFCCWITGSALPAAAQETIVQYLSGTDKDHTVEWDFYCTKGRKSGQWSKIPVPSNWELQGFGEYNYGWEKDKSDEVGQYKHTFQVPAEWKDKMIYIAFEGAMTDTEVKLNGQLAGPLHQGGFYRFIYNITTLIRYGAENALEVKVSKMSANASINKAERSGDFWALGGIFRPVYLQVVPATHIDRVAIDAKADGAFRMDVYATNLKKNQLAEAQVQQLNGEKVGEAFTVKATSAGQSSLTLSQSLKNPALWNPEFPNLYRVVVSLKDAKGTMHTITQRFGFRTVELKPRDGIYVNGQKVVFKGVNRHSAWPETGRTLSKKISLLDVNLMKEMNMNAVRMSHYPPDQHFLDVCDSLGLFVLDELTGWQAKYDTEAGRKLVKELVVRDVNHPSILFWDNGNEGGWNTDLDGDYALYDPQKRLVLHPWEKFNGTDTKHYINYNYLVNASLYGQEILMPTEFMHGLYDGGHAAGLDDFWNLMLRHPYCAGGFLWAFHDEGIVRTDKNGMIDTYKNAAPDGIVGPHREKEASFFAIKEIWSPVQVEQRYLTPTFTGKLAVENRFVYTNLAQCSFEWKLVSFPGPEESTQSAATSGSATPDVSTPDVSTPDVSTPDVSTDASDRRGSTTAVQQHVISTGKPKPPSLKPGEKGWLELGLPENWQQADALYLTAYDPHTREIFTWTWAIPSPALLAAKAPKSTNPASLQVAEQGNSLVVSTDGVTYHFDKTTGYIQKVVKGQATISLSEGPLLAGVNQKLKQFNHRKEGNDYVVEPVYEEDSKFYVKWTFSPNKPVKLEYRYSQKGEPYFMGVTFRYPEEKITGMKWLGRGPYRVWKNRLKGQQFGVWQKAYNNGITGESWQYPEFKGYHSELYWVRVENKEAPFTVYADNEGIFLQMLKPTKPAGAGNENTSPPFPEGNLGFLNAISAIGTKFQEAEQMGPESQKNMMMNYTPISNTLWFDFR